MGKRRRQECDCKRRRKHLYLVLDDWDNGFSLHKMDALSLLDDSDDDGGRELERLPDLRRSVSPRRDSPLCSSPAWAPASSSPTRYSAPPKSPAPSSTTRRRPPWPWALPPENTCCFFVAVSRGETKDEKLYTLGKTYHRDRSEHPRGHLVGVSVHALSWARSPAALAEPWLPSHEWAWESVAAPTAPFDGNEETVVLRGAPGRAHHILLDEKQEGDLPAPIPSTRSGGSGGRGREWVLPFIGAGYSREIDAWVGLHEDGYICCWPPRPRRSSAGVEEDGAEVSLQSHVHLKSLLEHVTVI
ncbi:hypothetical protein ZWY2020_030213 [Hordeum vulgare]|nr:hypothetical protein ZWY2020_030213 [Hordeum vulgare]